MTTPHQRALAAFVALVAGSAGVYYYYFAFLEQKRTAAVTSERKDLRLRKETTAKERLPSLIRELFDAHDLNRTGSLTEANLVEINKRIAFLHLGKLRRQFSLENEYRPVFLSIDLDGNGIVTFDEFQKHTLASLGEKQYDTSFVTSK